MNVVRVLEQLEPACIDCDRLDALFRGLGPIAAEDLVTRAIEELAIAMNDADNLYRRGDVEALQIVMADIGNIAEQIGLSGVSLIAGHVADTIRQGNGIALAAVIARLLRVGERSLVAIWDVPKVPG